MSQKHTAWKNRRSGIRLPYRDQKDMKFNDKTPEITVNPETYEVRVDGKAITSSPAKKLPLTQLYSLF